MIVDLFAGPGGWDEGLRMLGRRGVIGVEWERWACTTARAAGHIRARGDVSHLDPARLGIGPVEGLIASPPCQAWSMAGRRGGEEDRAACHELADRMARGDDSTNWREWADGRSPLVAQPVRWVRELRPEWVALEEVPAVLGLWEHIARIFRAWGYSTWTGILNAADYGVPQTRQRAILVASRVHLVTKPAPTHSKDRHAADLFGDGLSPWVSMAEALGWGATFIPAPTIHAGKTGSGRVWGSDQHGSARALLAEQSEQRWLRGSNQAHAALRHESEPAPTLLFGHCANDVRWYFDRPATTVLGPQVAKPGHRDRAGGERQFADSVRVTVTEAAVLQSFPPDYPWRGSNTRRYEQIGNAVPPLLAAHVLAEAIGIQFAGEQAA